MYFLRVLAIVILTVVSARAQNPVVKKPIDTATIKLDTIGSPAYVNQGKIAAHKAAIRSLIFPGLGQLYNYGLVVDDVKNGRTEGKRIAQKVYILGKTAAIYGGGTVLVLSYIDNRKNYKLFLNELQYRKLNSNQPSPDNGLGQYPNTDALTIAKNIYKRNSQVVLISMIGLYGLNVLDAYVTARLKYFNIDETLTFKISPSTINTNTMFGYQNITPALKLSLRL